MASYLYQYVPQTLQPYNSPLQLFQQGLAIKDEKFKSALSSIKNKQDSILNTPLTNEEDQLTLKHGMDSAMDQLNKTAPLDVSLPENQAQINGVLDNVLNDQDLMYDAAWTRNHRNELKRAEDLQKKSPELVPPQNLEPLYLAQEQFRGALKGSRPAPVQFSSYYDYNKKMNDDLDKIKADVERVFSVSTNQVEGPDGQMHSVSSPLQYTVKQLKDYKIQQLAWSRVNTDSQTLNQMSLDYKYNTRNGLYPAQAATSGIDQEMSTYKSISSALATALNTGTGLDNKPLDANTRDNYNDRQKNVNSEIQRLQGLKNDINLDPSKSNQWFTFNKYIKDYVEGKVSQYNGKEDSLISSVPGLDKLTEYQLDVWKEQWKEKFKAESTAAKPGKLGDFVPVPYQDLIMRLSDSPNGIPATNQEISDLGQMDTPTTGPEAGNMYMNWSGDNKTAGSTLIFKPGSGSFSKDQVATIDAGVIIKKLTQELDQLGIETPHGTPPLGMAYNTYGAPSGGGVIPKVSGSDLLDQYSKDPNLADRRVKDIVANYQTVLSKYGINLNDMSSIRNVKDKLKDPNIAKAVDFGSTINLNGRFQFTPDPDNNVILGDNGKLYMSGKFIVPEYKIQEAVGDTDGKYVRDLVKDWDIVTSGGDPGDKYKKMNQRLYGVHVYVPVNGDVTQINDRMLETQGYQKQWGDKAPALREQSKEGAVRFQDLLGRSSSISDLNIPYLKAGPDGNYSIKPSLGERFDKDFPNKLNKVSELVENISTRTGIDPGQLNQQILNILGQTSNPVRRMAAIDNLGISALQGSSSGFRSFPTYEAGRNALESQLNLYKTGQTKNNVGPTSTLLQAMSIYAPSSDNNNPQAYAQRIASALGISINTPISQIDTKRWADIIEQVEGNKRGDNNPGNLRP